MVKNRSYRKSHLHRTEVHFTLRAAHPRGSSWPPAAMDAALPRRPEARERNGIQKEISGLFGATWAAGLRAGEICKSAATVPPQARGSRTPECGEKENRNLRAGPRSAMPTRISPACAAQRHRRPRHRFLRTPDRAMAANDASSTILRAAVALQKRRSGRPWWSHCAGGLLRVDGVYLLLDRLGSEWTAAAMSEQ